MPCDLGEESEVGGEDSDDFGERSEVGGGYPVSTGCRGVGFLPKNTSSERRIYKILKSSEFWNPVRPPETALTSNGPSTFMPTPIWEILDLMESLSCYLSNASGLISKFIPSQRESSKQDSVVID